jgi:2-iminoacetate synthase ThiH
VAIYRRLARLQEVLGSLRAFAPLPRRTPAARQAAVGDLARRVALARLLVHNIDTIQVDWTRHGSKAAARALRFGADDLDSVSPVDRTPAGRPRWPLAEVRRNIRTASLVPVERNGRFERAGS